MKTADEFGSQGEAIAVGDFRRYIRDLSAVLALPARWSGMSPREIGEGLLSALLDILRLDITFARFEDPGGQNAFEAWRPASDTMPVAVSVLFTANHDPTLALATRSMPVAPPDQQARMMTCYPALVGERSLVIVGCTRPDFPTDFESTLVQAAVDQAAVAIRAARQLEAVKADRELAEAGVTEGQDFIATVSHDLKNPLGAIKAQAQLLHRHVQRANPPDTERLLGGLEQIDATATRMTAQIDELLDQTRLQAGKDLDLQRQAVDLVMLTRQAVEEAQQTSDLHLIRIASPVSTLVGYWDPIRLHRVLANLLSNAIKYSPRGGTIRVTIALGRDERPGSHWASIAVTDEGIGIPEADLPEIFERYRRGGNVAGLIAGSGVGLAGSLEIVEEHGGSITVESSEGAGSTFKVILPLVPPRRDSAE
ncbi:MAG: sensor histidine kinase [Thermomicrobiales bacterium]